jgi:1-deoxy-D-xylulose-5-phosphate reductoisomerase
VKRILLFGSTGSIGRNVLDIVAKNSDRFRVELLSCHNNVELIVQQARQFNVPAVLVGHEPAAETARNSLPATTNLLVGAEA